MKPQKISIEIIKKKNFFGHKNGTVRGIEPGIPPLWTQNPNHYTVEVLVIKYLYSSMV